MAAQWGVQPSADVLMTLDSGKMPVEFRLSKRSRLARHLAALIAAVAVIVSTGAYDPSSLAANPPHKPPTGGPSPQQLEKQLQEQQRKEQHMLQELLKQQERWHKQMQKKREEYLKQQLRTKAAGPKGNVPHHPAKPHHPGKPHLPPIGPTQFPNRKHAYNELVQALRHVNAAADFPIEPKEVALGNIREAVLGLGEAPPGLAPPIQRGNHIHWAEVHLQNAHKDVFYAMRLPHEVKMAVLAEINRAMYVLHHHGMPFPKMELARKELVRALHQVHAAGGLPPRPKDEALTNIRQALLGLGEVPPALSVPSPKGDHIRLAEGHLRVAYKDVVEARHLPSGQRAPVLWEIHKAMFALTHSETPLPNMKAARDELVKAWHQVDAASRMEAALKELALTSIGEAIIQLGENPPRPRGRVSEGDHIKWAEESLHTAREDVVSKKHLPQHIKEPVLEEIQRATVALKHSVPPVGGGTAAIKPLKLPKKNDADPGSGVAVPKKQ